MGQVVSWSAQNNSAKRIGDRRPYSTEPVQSISARSLRGRSSRAAWLSGRTTARPSKIVRRKSRWPEKPARAARWCSSGAMAGKPDGEQLGAGSYGGQRGRSGRENFQLSTHPPVKSATVSRSAASDRARAALHQVGTSRRSDWRSATRLRAARAAFVETTSLRSSS